MDTSAHTMEQLFMQLGLPSETAHVDAFIDAHRPLANGMPLYRADFWTPSQRAFLKEEIIEDSDWSAVIDELNERMH